MKYFGIVLCLLLAGCSTWLRYDYESALTNIPKDATVVKITNDYIEYSIVTNRYKAYYDVNGKVYRIE